MKQIGLIGGMSWESTKEYYRILNQLAAKELGGLHSAECIIASVDFGPIAEWMHRDEWEPIRKELISKARSLERAGAELVLIATNTMHLLADDVAAGISVPLLHIADAAGEACVNKGLKRVALMGTKFTMEMGFYTEKLKNTYGLKVVIPENEDRKKIDGIIFNELCAGIFTESSREYLIRTAGRLIEQGAEGVILGCTELPLMVKASDLPVPVLDTMELHAEKAFYTALND
ncbi:aspartate/glutamate racemase family protein [Marispirochaeta sp.]|jgi:aspartate racemase|uniref:aspartate/glutamate racemase family protein n=1 Tax=Marispirochaeta sp. TaxID=2038653 RepID=UPI0029C7BBA6|nr:aspartate/glutamate racemase family protein [Marispirochaeta sp.]